MSGDESEKTILVLLVDISWLVGIFLYPSKYSGVSWIVSKV